MAEQQRFRSAFNGFNRGDVVQYIEFLTNKHNAQLNQMRTEMDDLRAELALARQAPGRSIKLESELAAALQRVSELEAALASVTAQLELSKRNIPAPIPVPAPAPVQSRIVDELEAYRRAERAERKANARAMEISVQANGVLADATARVDETAAQFSEMAAMLADKLAEFREMMIASKTTLQDAATAMYAIRPGEDDI